MEKTEYCEKSDTETLDSEYTTKKRDVKKDPPVTYLYRSSTKERVFVPENHGTDKKTDDYIAFDKSEDVIFEKEASGVSSHLMRKEGNKKLKPKRDSSSEEDVQVPKKKPRKEWVVDKKGVKQKQKYHPVNLVRVSSNPNRVGKKRKI